MTNKNLLGYRFSVVDRYGNNKVSKVIDVFRSTSDAPYADYACDYDYKFTTKYNKKQLINNQNCNYSTSVNSTWCYKQDEMGFASSLPEPDGLETWQNNTTNLNKILATLLLLIKYVTSLSFIFVVLCFLFIHYIRKIIVCGFINIIFTH